MTIRQCRNVWLPGSCFLLQIHGVFKKGEISMAQTDAAVPYPGRPFADRVAPVAATAPLAWLAGGLRDFRAAFGTSLAYGMIFVLAGIVLAAALLAVNMAYLFVPLASGFMLIGPAATLGLY